jgi:5-methylcytosine-specific restriction endonuclease McrA
MPEDLFPCSTCHELKPLSDFNKYRRNKDRHGHSHECKACVNKRAQSWYHRNKAKRSVQITAWQLANPEKVSQSNKIFKIRHKATIAAKRHAIKDITNAKERERYKNNPEPVLRRTRQYYAENSKQHHQWTAAWYKKHPGKARENAHRRNARKRNAAINDLSAKQIQEIMVAKDFRCDYCGRTKDKLTIDHITPLAKGGNNTLWNVTVACQTCNSKKQQGPPPKPVQPLLLTIARPKKKAS